jgi:competence protein ComEA
MRTVLMLLAIAAIVSTTAATAAAQQPAAASAKPAAAAKTAKAASPKPTQAATPVNLNSATQAQLESLPGLGAKVAERILDYRQKNGQFKKVEDLMNVKGIGEKSFLKLKPLLKVSDKAEPSGTPDRQV